MCIKPLETSLFYKTGDGGIENIQTYKTQIIRTSAEVLKYKRAVQDLLHLDKTAEFWIPVPKAYSP